LSGNLSTDQTGGAVGVQHRLTFDPRRTPIAAAADGWPDCTAVATLDFSGFSFAPAGCTPGVDCTTIKAVLTSMSATPLQGTTRLSTCRVQIAPGTRSGRYGIGVERVMTAGSGGDLRGASGVAGYVDVIS
jgi:hypothetical protein